MMRQRSCRALALALGLALAAVGGAGAQGGPWVAPTSEKAKKSPVAASPQAVLQGRKVAAANCASCHGPGGKGNGPAAMALTPKPADWTSKKVQDETDGEMFWKITTGRGAMPAWRHLPENDRWAIVQYLRSLKN
ncbi:MAG TPA: cytochrome c [Candidatus Limnocylindrales bacterium]|nr:cytochrome c [Candidatus Limnocylindrales bacterium]